MLYVLRDKIDRLYCRMLKFADFNEHLDRMEIYGSRLF